MQTSPSSTIAAVERRFLRAHPALESECYDGWVLRFANGYTGRANSATTLLGGHRPFSDRLAYTVDWFATRSQPPLVRITPLGLHDDKELAATGWARIKTTVALGRPLQSMVTVAGTNLSWAGLEDWLAALTRLGGVTAPDATIYGHMLSRLEQPAVFATVNGEDGPVAAGRAVVANDTLMVFNVAVAPRLRRRSLGSAVMGALAEWASDRADTVQLFVQADNDGALAFYRALGFDELYRYWYRQRPRRGSLVDHF